MLSNSINGFGGVRQVPANPPPCGEAPTLR
jgi:hypothetical protein